MCWISHSPLGDERCCEGKWHLPIEELGVLTLWMCEALKVCSSIVQNWLLFLKKETQSAEAHGGRSQIRASFSQHWTMLWTYGLEGTMDASIVCSGSCFKQFSDDTTSHPPQQNTGVTVGRFRNGWDARNLVTSAVSCGYLWVSLEPSVSRHCGNADDRKGLCALSLYSTSSVPKFHGSSLVCHF